MTTAISHSTSTQQGPNTSIAARQGMDHDSKVIAIFFAAAIALSVILSAVAILVYNTASPEQLEQISTMMSGYTPAL